MTNNAAVGVAFLEANGRAVSEYLTYVPEYGVLAATAIIGPEFDLETTDANLGKVLRKTLATAENLSNQGYGDNTPRSSNEDTDINHISKALGLTEQQLSHTHRARVRVIRYSSDDAWELSATRSNLQGVQGKARSMELPANSSDARVGAIFKQFVNWARTPDDEID